MQIEVVSKIGRGRTELSAYDDALVQMHCTGYNLVHLSSVVPVGAQVIQKDTYSAPPNQIGHRLYVVEASMRSRKVGGVVAAGIGWYQLSNKERGGLFVEHELTARSEKQAKKDLEKLIYISLEDLCRFRNEPFRKSNVGMSTAVATVKSKPTCALTLAIFGAESWQF